MTALIPRTVLFGSPTRLSPALSPCGRYLAYLAPIDGVLNLWAGTVGGDEARPVADNHGRGIDAYAWAHDGRHLVYLQDRDGDENTHLFAVDLAAGTTRDLTPFDGVQARLVGLEGRRPGEVLVTLNRRSRPLHDAYRLDLTTGEPTMAAENRGFAGWVHDRDLNVRAAFEWTDDGGSALLIRPDESADWRRLYSVGHQDATTTRPIGFEADGRRLVILSSLGANTARLVSLDVATGASIVLYEDPRYDVVGVGLHPVTKRADLVVVQRERNHLEALDAAVAADVDRVRDLGRGDVSLLSRDDADRTWLVQDNIDDGAACFYRYDRVTGRADFLFAHLPEIEQYTLARMEPFRFRARDGLVVHGYLTFPPGFERRALPAVLNVHGGPWIRDVWGFRAEPQWLANRGYLCVQVNFRGSTGYGKDFVNAGDREWGARMHDDLVDAVRWIVDRGYADPRRIGIYGGSYGGYAALVGATFTPGVFRCALSVAGPSNLLTFVASALTNWTPMAPRMRHRIGDPETEADFLWSRSPLSRIDQIRIPVLIAHGANDPRVPRAEAEQIVAELRRKRLPHEYLLFEDEGHGFAKPHNRLRFYAAAERFLADHLGGRYEPAVEG